VVGDGWVAVCGAGLWEAGSRSAGYDGVRLGCLGQGMGWAGDWVRGKSSWGGPTGDWVASEKSRINLRNYRIFPPNIKTDGMRG
jgi:hypothetical protein